MKLRLRLSSLSLIVVLLAGCAAHGPSQPSRLMSAIDANNQAAAALSRAEYAVAERLYLQALQHDRAIENTEGVALNLIALAVTYQRAGRLDEALRTAGLVNVRQLPEVSSARVAEAELLSASLRLARAEWGVAAQHLQEVERHCPGTSCQLAGRIANIRAQLAIVDNRIDEAATLAKRALQLAEAANDQEELANALRVAGNASLFADPAAGIRYVERALAIDKKLALSGKIFRDLLMLGRLHLALGDRERAGQLAVRARSVAEADRNEAGLKEVMDLERELGEKK